MVGVLQMVVTDNTMDLDLCARDEYRDLSSRLCTRCADICHQPEICPQACRGIFTISYMFRL